uniref:Uncharacterized protein n=1 Tax=viral metagenome TaxID=1070528 RepID=A0A6C0BQN1_9ZZZZ
MMYKQEISIFVVMVCLLFVIIKLHKTHFEQFRLLNCDISKTIHNDSDEDYLCCTARNMLMEIDDTHASYSYYYNINEQCQVLSSINIQDPLSDSYNPNFHYDALDSIYNTLVTQSNDLSETLRGLQSDLDLLESTYESESNSYVSLSNLYSASNTHYGTLSNIKSHLDDMKDMHAYKAALSNLDDVINNDTLDTMGIRTGLKYKEIDIKTEIENSLQKAINYIPKLSELYIYNVKLFESIKKTEDLITGQSAGQPGGTDSQKTHLSNSKTLYSNSILFMNKSETTLYRISERIKQLSSDIYQTNFTPKNIVVNINTNNINITYDNENKYRLPVNIIHDDSIYIHDKLFNQCTSVQLTCGNFDTATTEVETDITESYKKQNTMSDAGYQLSSSLFVFFMKKFTRESIISNNYNITKDVVNENIIHAFLLKTFPPLE